MRASRRALAAMLALGLAGCGGAQSTTTSGEGAPAATQPADPRSPAERRRDAACDQLGPKITACAVEDAKADFAAGKINQDQLKADIAPEVQHKNTDEFEQACKGHKYSSRQIRVLEVCFQSEPQCSPLLDCLGHLNDPADPKN